MSLPPAPGLTTCTLACSLAVAASLHAAPGYAENIWSRTEVPSEMATYPTPETLAVLEATRTTASGEGAETPVPAAMAPPAPASTVVLAAAPDYNSWRGAPGAAWGAPTSGGFPFLCGSFGFGGGNRGGFSFGF